MVSSDGEPVVANNGTSTQIDGMAVEDMDLAQFSEAIRNMYLPFTLRKMYYRELMLRKPLFVGASRKGVGFGGDGVI